MKKKNNKTNWFKASAHVLNKISQTVIKQKKHYDAIIEQNLHLSFISLLGANNLIGEVMDNSLDYFYKSRNAYWFKKFFEDEDLYELIKEDIEFYYKKYPKIRLTLTKDGTMVYDNYQENHFNILLLTIHGGTWIPDYVNELMAVSKATIYCEEDIATDYLYGPLVLEKGGIWINAKQSRFVCDFNRAPERAIYSNNSEARVKDIWKQELTSNQKKRIMKSYQRFYQLLDTLIDTYRFNIVFDGHSMVDEPGRPSLSFGVKFVPQFYGPIVAEMRRTLIRETKEEVEINKPYSGGYILEYLSGQFPDIFIFSMEINKKLYMDNKCLKIKKRRLFGLSKAVNNIFDF